ncbi:MAG: ABC transporter substrate-binding protein, partial [Microthrixaceae bacterium]|nr:ABC transporter substrate-binding protein [Microthrixaceae bacterium]
KNNLDAYRGQYEGRSPLLFIFVLDNIDTVEATDDMTVTVTTKTPWPSFPNFLWSDGRVGMIGQAQLDDAEECDKNLIGTGPFIKKEWKINDSFLAERNPDYWQTDADGTQLPYLDEIEFRPQSEMNQRVEGIQTGMFDAAHIQGGQALSLAEPLAEQGQANLVANSDFAEVSYLLFNERQPPFDNLDARMAVAQALDR